VTKNFGTLAMAAMAAVLVTTASAAAQPGRIVIGGTFSGGSDNAQYGPYDRGYPPAGGYGYESRGGQYGRQDFAFRNGYREGFDEGFRDARRGRRPDYGGHGYYRDGYRGYGRDYGQGRDYYRGAYRRGFAQGYEQGYREARRAQGPGYGGQGPGWRGGFRFEGRF
jgi:hypothetical protein